MWLKILGLALFSYLTVSVPINESRKPRTYFNITKNEFKEKCIERNPDLLLQLKGHFENFKATIYQHTKAAKVEIINGMNILKDDLLENLIKKHCFENKNITENLEKMFDFAQTCLDQEERFDEIDKNNYLLLTINSICSFMTLASVVPCRIGENNETVTYEAPFENCLKVYFKVHIRHFISLPFAKRDSIL